MGGLVLWKSILNEIFVVVILCLPSVNGINGMPPLIIYQIHELENKYFGEEEI